MKTGFAVLIVSLSFLASESLAQTPKASVFAGSGFGGLVDGKGEKTMFGNPTALAVDGKGDLYVGDGISGVVGFTLRRISPDATVVTLPSVGPIRVVEMAPSANGNLFLGEENSLSYFNTTTKEFSSFANPGNGRGYQDGPAQQAYFNSGGRGLHFAVAKDDTVFVADSDNNRIRKIAGNMVSTFAGSGNPGTVDGEGIFSSFYLPHGIAINSIGQLFVWQTDGKVRIVDRNGKVSTTTAIKVGGPPVLFDDQDNLYVTLGNSVIQYDQSFQQRLSFLTEQRVGGLAIDKSNNLFISDPGASKIFIVRLGQSQPVNPPASLELKLYPGVTITGTPGRTFRVEAASAVAGPWSSAALVTLSEPSQVWIDKDSVSGRKFYRAVLLP